MTFEEILNQALAMLQRQGRVSYRALKRQFGLDDAYIEDLKFEIIEVYRTAVDQDNTMLVWAVKLFELGRLTSGQAAQLAGVSRVTFLLECHRFGVPSVSWDHGEIAAEFQEAQP